MPNRREGGQLSAADEWDRWWWRQSHPTPIATKTPYGTSYDYTPRPWEGMAGPPPESRGPDVELIRQKLLNMLPLELPTNKPKQEQPSTGETIVGTILNAGATAAGLGSIYDLGKLIFGGGK